MERIDMKPRIGPVWIRFLGELVGAVRGSLLASRWDVFRATRRSGLAGDLCAYEPRLGRPG